MKPQQDETAFEWIRDGRDARRPPGIYLSQDEPGLSVSYLIPPIYEAYAKILHRIDARFDFIDAPLSPRENAILKIPSCEPLTSFVEQRRANGTGTRIRWRELAGLLEVPFTPEINHEWYRKKLHDPWCWPRLLYGPGDGAISKEEQVELGSMLTPYARNEQCFLLFSHIAFYPPRNAGMPRLFKGTLHDLGGLPTHGPYCVGPEYWWPSDRSWCVCSEYDLKYTFIGGPKGLISSLLSSRVLECIEVPSRTRVYPFAPMP